MKRVYFIGAGPGDPELLTLKGAQLLAGCRTVFAPTPFEQTFSALLQGKRVLIPFDYDFDELVDKVRELLQQGEVAFLIPGDLTVFSPFQALIDCFGEQALVVPGVGTANVASAFLKKSFHQSGLSNRVIIASPKTLADDEHAPAIGQLAAPGVTLLIYMNNLPLDQLVAQLRQGYGKNVPIVLCHRLGLPGEEVVQGTLDDIGAKAGGRDYFNLQAGSKRSALTLVLVGDALAGTVDGSWWDLRREQIWKHADHSGLSSTADTSK